MAFIDGKEILFSTAANVTMQGDTRTTETEAEGTLAALTLGEANKYYEYELDAIDAAGLGFETPLTKLGIQFVGFPNALFEDTIYYDADYHEWVYDNDTFDTSGWERNETYLASVEFDGLAYSASFEWNANEVSWNAGISNGVTISVDWFGTVYIYGSDEQLDTSTTHTLKIYTGTYEEQIFATSNGLQDIKTATYGAFTYSYIGNLSLTEVGASLTYEGELDTGENYLLYGIGNEDKFGTYGLRFIARLPDEGGFVTWGGSLTITTLAKTRMNMLDALIMGIAKEISGDAAYVGDYVFSDQSSLTRVDLPKATSIGESAFILAENLKTVNLPNVTSIKRNAFGGCYSLTTANIPNLTSAEDYAFRNCSSLTEANFPKLTSTLRTFYGCTSLTKVNFPNLTIVGESDFQGCTSLNEVNIPNAITIGSGAFYDCTNLTTLNFPNVKEILSLAFSGCTALTKLDLLCSEGVYIDSRAFKDCTNLTALILRSTEQVHTLVNADALTGTAIANAMGYIYVPSALIDVYRSDTVWTAYAGLFRAIEDYPDICG